MPQNKLDPSPMLTAIGKYNFYFTFSENNQFSNLDINWESDCVHIAINCNVIVCLYMHIHQCYFDVFTDRVENVMQCSKCQAR